MPEQPDAERGAEEEKFAGFDRALSQHDRRLAGLELLEDRVKRLEDTPVPAPVDELARPRRSTIALGALLVVCGAFLVFTTPRREHLG